MGAENFMLRYLLGKQDKTGQGEDSITKAKLRNVKKTLRKAIISLNVDDVKTLQEYIQRAFDAFHKHITKVAQRVGILSV